MTHTDSDMAPEAEAIEPGTPAAPTETIDADDATSDSAAPMTEAVAEAEAGAEALAEGDTEAVAEVAAAAKSGPKWWTILAWVAVLVAVATLALSGYAYAVDRRETNLIPRGVEVAGVAIGGLTKADARELVTATVDARTDFEVAVTDGATEWTLSARDCVQIDIDTALIEAASIRDQAPLVDRLRHDLLGEPIARDVSFEVALVQAPIADLVNRIASEVETVPVDASLALINGVPVWSAGNEGVAVDRAGTIAQIEDGLREALDSTPIEGAVAPDDVEVELVRTTTAQEVTLDDLAKRAILVDLSSKKLTLYEQGKVLRTWPVATGTPGFPTPRGTFRIVLKRYMPTWGNPGSDWAKNMPPSIPPGPTNPLGLRALNLNISGIRIHGTSNIASLGTAASHGCVRMANADIVKLYDMVEVGTTVYIVR